MTSPRTRTCTVSLVAQTLPSFLPLPSPKRSFKTAATALSNGGSHLRS
eukprot:CAMPEP_0117516832 /NCGR_PEP_ID=MMETSP0784-20121206/31297_1 /TAXON_ID=39447 /ORGANISM="" /LENGTH=47 /DNA_ID= /DNA_START= /DNA_END= /DNA_ORIENTATION=